MILTSRWIIYFTGHSAAAVQDQVTATNPHMGGECDVTLYSLNVKMPTSAGNYPFPPRQYGTTLCEVASGIAITPSGDAVYITGTSDAGTTTWTQGPNPGVSATAVGGQDVFTIKVSTSDGYAQWIRLTGAGGSGVHDQGKAAAVSMDDASVYVLGTAAATVGTSVSNGGQDLAIFKFDSAGVQQWVKLVGSSASDIAIGLTLDRSDNPVWIGQTTSQMTAYGSVAPSGLTNSQVRTVIGNRLCYTLAGTGAMTVITAPCPYRPVTDPCDALTECSGRMGRSIASLSLLDLSLPACAL